MQGIHTREARRYKESNTLFTNDIRKGFTMCKTPEDLDLDGITTVCS
jgi:hypothetical protein